MLRRRCARGACIHLVLLLFPRLCLDSSLTLAPSHTPHTPLLDSPDLLSRRRAMASFFPDEIVLLIFETLARPHWDREGYSERQGTLSRLALVCRRFHRLAEPLLWRQLRFDNWQGSTLRKVQRLLPKFGQHVRAMKANTRYRTYDDEQISTQQVAEVVRMSTALTEVRVMLNVRSKNDGLFKRLAGLTGTASFQRSAPAVTEPSRPQALHRLNSSASTSTNRCAPTPLSSSHPWLNSTCAG